MSVAAERRTETDQRFPRLGFGLVAASVVCLIAAGGLLWWRRGEAVFGDVVLAALAWCF